MELTQSDLSLSCDKQTILNTVKLFVGKHLIGAWIPEYPGIGLSSVQVALRFLIPTVLISLLVELL